MDDLISRQAAIDAIHCDIIVTGRQNAELVAATIGAFADRIKALPPVQPDVPDTNVGNMEPMDVSKTEQADGWMERNKDRILQAGLEGREVEFRIGGRLFAIREKAQ